MSKLSEPEALARDLVGESAAMVRLRDEIARAAPCDVNLLLLGESGTGKELAAKTVHGLSGRRRGPFIGVNCAAIHESLLESELFGHEAGAFTGAHSATIGFLRAAEGGTILLDEVGDMSLALQSKLLRVLEERAVTPVGGTRPVPLDVRVVAATHKDLAREVSEGSFRADLYYRLNVVCLRIPPLRDRRGDVPVLVRHLVGRIATALAVEPKEVTPEAMDALLAYDWPGNVRQLANVIQRAYVLAHGRAITPTDLPDELRGRTGGAGRAAGSGFPTLDEMTRGHVEQALQLAGGVRSRAAELLGIDRKTLWRMIRRYELEVPAATTR